MFERLQSFAMQPIAAPGWLKWIGTRAARWLEPLQPYVQRIKQAWAPVWEAGRAWFEKREPREKLLLRVAGAILAVLLLYSLIYSPIVDLREGLADRVDRRRNELIELRGLMPTYGRLQRALALAERKTVQGNANFSLFSVLEQTLTKNVGRDHIGSITPTDRNVTGGFHQYGIDIKLNGINLPQVVDTLYGVQSLGIPVTVSNMQVHQHANDSHSYDVDLTCVALAKSG